ncbi:MAG: hypothetical protein AAGA11_11545 [Pseudomonadota bacterium]
MLDADAEARMKAIDKDIVKVAMLDAPGTALVGLGLYAKFAANGDAFLPFLNDSGIVNLMLVAGVGIMLWGARKVFLLISEKQRLKTQYGL